jgi:hypothetical protein
MPTSVDRLQTHLGLRGARPEDEDAMLYAVDASNDWVSTLRPDLPVWAEGDDSVVWPPRVDEAATLLAAFLYSRRGTVTGVASFQDAGVAALPQTDPSLASLLELGRYQLSVTA